MLSTEDMPIILIQSCSRLQTIQCSKPTSFHKLARFKPVGKVKDVIWSSPGPFIYTKYLCTLVKLRVYKTSTSGMPPSGVAVARPSLSQCAHVNMGIASQRLFSTKYTVQAQHIGDQRYRVNANEAAHFCTKVAPVCFTDICDFDAFILRRDRY